MKKDMSENDTNDEEIAFYPFESNGEESGARDENFCLSLKLFCCPKLTIFQFIVIISIIEIVIYIISLCIWGLSNEDILAPNYDTLKIMGAADAKSTKNNY